MDTHTLKYIRYIAHHSNLTQDIQFKETEFISILCNQPVKDFENVFKEFSITVA